MKINEEIYDNLYEFIRNLCKIRNLNILLSDITSLSSYEELILTTPSQSRSYISINIENFYNEIIEPSKIEYYG